MSTRGKPNGQKGVGGISEILDTSGGLLLGIRSYGACLEAAFDSSTRTPTVTPFVVRYPFDVLRAVSPSTLLRTLRFPKGQVEPLTANLKENSIRNRYPFTLRYRRVNG
jgi:hypothetical protein